MQAQSIQKPEESHYSKLAWAIVALGAFFYCYEYFLRIAPSVMEPELRAAFKIDATGFGTLSAFYYYAYTPMQPIVGVWMDRYGPRRLLIMACLACSLGTFLFALSGYPLSLAQFGQFLVGFGSAFAFVGVLKLTTIWLPSKHFAKIAGSIMCLAMTGALIGDYALASLIESVGWHEVLVYSAAMGIVLALFKLFIIRDRSESPLMREDMIERLTYAKVLSGFAQLVKNPQLWINGIIGMLTYVALSGLAETWGPSFIEKFYQMPRAEAIHMNAIIFGGWAVGAPLMGWLSDYLGKRRLLLLLGSLFGAVSFAVLLYVPGLSTTTLQILFFLFGVFTSSQILVFAVAHEIASIELAGTAIAFTNMIVMLSGSIFKTAIGSLLDFRWAGAVMDGIRVYSGADFQFAVSSVLICLVVSTIFACFLKETGGAVHH